MSRVLFLTDLHTRWEKAEKILSTNEYDLAIIGGDEFDQFYDTPEINAKTAEWVKYSINQPNRIHIWANHTIAYGFPYNDCLKCSGFAKEKALAINSVLTKEDWNKFKLYHFEDGIFYSHAGAHPYVFCDVNEEEMTLQSIEKKCKKALDDAVMCIPNPVTSAGKGRGGWEWVGGLTWLDHRTEAIPVKNWKMVYGHTPHEKPNYKKLDKNSFNLCMDTHLEYYAIITDGKIKIKKSK